MPSDTSSQASGRAGFVPRTLLFAALGLGLLGVACAEWSLEPARSDVEGCYDLSILGSEEAPAPSPPRSVSLTNGSYLPPDASPAELGRYRFDASTAREAFFVYADTAYRVAWWWVDERAGRFGVGNLNTAAAFYIEAVVSAEQLDGELRRWRFDQDGEPVLGPDSWTAPVSGRMAACDRQ